MYADVTWVSSYEVNPFDVPVGREGGAAHRLDRAAARGARRSTTPRRASGRCWRTSTTPTPPARSPPSSGSGSTPRRRRWARARTPSTRCAPSRRRSAAGWEYLHRDRLHDWDAELDEIPELLAEKLKAPSVEAGRYDLVIHPSNLWLTIHESIGHATELDRALGYEANYAGTSFATYDKLGTLQYGSGVMNVTGDRTVEHGLRHHRLRRRGRADPELGHRPRRRAGRLPARPPDGPPQARAQRRAAPTAARTPTPPATSRSSGWPTSRSSRPRTGPSTEELIGRVEHGLYVVGDKSWSIDMQRFNFQFTGQRFYKITDGELTGQVRDAAYQATTTDFWGAMEAVGGPQTWELGGAFNCGKAQPGPGARRSATAARPRCSATSASSTRPRSPADERHVQPVHPQSLVEHALATSMADDCVVIVRDATSANLRWANNTLTTNGVMHGVHVSVVSFVDQAGGVATRLGVSGSATTQAEVDELVRAADAAARAAVAGRGRRRAGRATAPRRTGTTSRAPPASRCTTPSRPRWARRSAAPRGGGPGPLRLRQPRGHHDVPRLDDRAAAAPRAADRPLRLHRQDRRPRHQRLGRPGHPRLQRHRPARLRGRAGAAAGLGQPQGRPRGRPLRHDPAADRGLRPDDLRLLGRRRARRLGGPVGLQPPAHRHPHRRGRSPGPR